MSTFVLENILSRLMLRLTTYTKLLSISLLYKPFDLCKPT